jgi:hypothetical protein
MYAMNLLTYTLKHDMKYKTLQIRVYVTLGILCHKLSQEAIFTTPISYSQCFKRKAFIYIYIYIRF